MNNQKSVSKKYAGLYYTLLALLLFVPIILSLSTKMWVLTAISIGVLFGFFLQKGDLCGASAFSEILLLRSWRKVFGIWVAIVVSMIGFAVLNSLGLIALNPKPFIWLNYIVGGVIFGVGMVLAGGCVSGCLYKAGAGNLNSMAGLVGIPIGVAMVEFGPFSSFHKYMKQFIIRADDGSSITLSSLTGLPYWLLALGFAIITILLVFFLSKQKTNSANNKRLEERIFFQSWKPWMAGLAIGLLSIPAYLSSAESGRNYPLGVTHGVLHAELLLTDQQFNHVFQKKTTTPQPAINAQNKSTVPAQNNSNPPKKIVWWLVALIISMVAGSFISGKLSGQTRLLPKPPEQTFIAFFGGILVGTGAAFATGCVIGNIFSGFALMSVGNYLFAVVAILANWFTTYFYLMGASLKKS